MTALETTEEDNSLAAIAFLLALVIKRSELIVLFHTFSLCNLTQKYVALHQAFIMFHLISLLTNWNGVSKYCGL